MKKCIIFFALLILALLFAVFTDNEELLELPDEVALTENSIKNILAEEQQQLTE